MAGTGVYGYRLESGGKLDIEGLKEVQADLRALGDATKNDMKETHRRAGEIVVQGAKRFVPVRTGKLLESMRSNPTMRMGRVRVGSASVPYAGPIHFGWPARSIRPQPFIYDVLDDRRNEIVQLYTQRIDQLINLHNLAPVNRTESTRAGSSSRSSEATSYPSSSQPDAFIRDGGGNITGGIYGTRVVRF